MFYLFNKKNVISPKEAYTIINSMGKGEKEVLVAFIKQEIEIEEKKNSLQEV
jgi:hypothetical protein